MPRRPNIEPSSRLELKLPESLRAKLDLILWSDAEGRVPHGAYAKFITRLLAEYFDKLAKEQQNVQS